MLSRRQHPEVKATIHLPSSCTKLVTFETVHHLKLALQGWNYINEFVISCCKCIVRHPNVWQGIPMYGTASQCTARDPTVWQGIPMYGRVSQCTAGHPNVWQGISMYGRASQCTARHLNVYGRHFCSHLREIWR